MKGVTVYLDEPRKDLIEDEVFDLVGWIGWIGGQVLKLSLHTERRALPLRFCDRPDAKEAYPSLCVIGFRSRVTVSDHLAALRYGMLNVYLLSSSTVLRRFSFRISSKALRRSIQRLAAC